MQNYVRKHTNSPSSLRAGSNAENLIYFLARQSHSLVLRILRKKLCKRLLRRQFLTKTNLKSARNDDAGGCIIPFAPYKFKKMKFFVLFLFRYIRSQCCHVFFKSGYPFRGYFTKRLRIIIFKLFRNIYVPGFL